MLFGLSVAAAVSSFVQSRPSFRSLSFPATSSDLLLAPTLFILPDCLWRCYAGYSVRSEVVQQRLRPLTVLFRNKPKLKKEKRFRAKLHAERTMFRPDGELVRVYNGRKKREAQAKSASKDLDIFFEQFVSEEVKQRLRDHEVGAIRGEVVMPTTHELVKLQKMQKWMADVPKRRRKRRRTFSP